MQFPHPGKAYAEYVLAPAHQLVHAPAGIPDEQLGAAPLAALTAYQALFEVAKLSAGERVLIQAGAGGIGHLAIQLALNAGATVYATASEKTVILYSLWAQNLSTIQPRISNRFSVLPLM